MDRAGAVACACEPAPEFRDWLRLGLGVVISGQLMLLSLAVNLSEMSGSERSRVLAATLGLTLLGVVLLGPELLASLRRSWASRELSLDAMFALAMFGGLGASIAGWVTGGPVFFEVVTVVLCVHAVGQRFKSRFWAGAFERVEQAGLFPRTAHRVEGALLRAVPIAELEAGELVMVYGGERVPASGRVVGGEAWVDGDAVDGERIPRWVEAGAEVTGGAAVRGGSLRVLVERAGPDELIARRQALLAAYAAPPAPGLAHWLARAFVPVVLLVAVGAGAVWTALAGVDVGFVVATSVLLVACPCGFGLATPVAAWAASSALAAQGVHVQRPAALEGLARVQTVAFDKTGTLTELDVTGACPEPLRSWVGALEQWFDHPLARILRRDARGGVAVRGARTLPGGGVMAEVQADGRWRELALRPVAGARDLELFVDGAPSGTVGVHERMVEGFSSVVAALAELGVEACVLTGDSVDPSVGLRCDTRCTPTEKSLRIQDFQRAGGVAFVGDRPNDLPAMAQAQVSFAVPDASALVAEAADVRIDGLDGVVMAVRGARALQTRLRRMLGLSLAGNVIGISVAAMGLLQPVVAALIMALSSLIVTLLAVPAERR